MMPDIEKVVEKSDGSLLRRYRGGSEDAATQLYVRYANRLLALAQANRSADMAARVDPEDIVQSVFRSFFQAARQGQYEVPQGEELWKILLVIALNKIRNQKAFHHAAKRDVRLTANGARFEQLLDEHCDEGTATQLLELTVQDALAGLIPQHREMVELRLQGYEVAQIAQATRRSKRTVERILQECRKHLHAIFHEPD